MQCLSLIPALAHPSHKCGCAPTQVLISPEDQRLAEEAEEWEAANTRRLQALTSLAPVPSIQHRQVCACSRQALGLSGPCSGTKSCQARGQTMPAGSKLDAGKHVMCNLQHVGCWLMLVDHLNTQSQHRS